MMTAEKISILNKKFYDISFCILISVLSLILYFMPWYGSVEDSHNLYVPGRVTAVENDLMQLGVYVQGEQNMVVTPLKGEYKGKNISVYNNLNANPQIDAVYDVGDKLLIQIMNPDTETLIGRPHGIYRLNAEILLTAAFALLLLLVAGWTGLKALLSFVFAGLMLIKVLFPMFLNGMNPMVAALIVIAVITAVILFLVGGLHEKGLVAFLGGFQGLLTTCILSLLFAKWMSPNGMSRAFAKNLLQCVGQSIDFQQLFLAGVMIAASGAVMDLAMDISSAMQEVYNQNQSITRFKLFQSGMRVARSVVGTMTTTLLLAYSGGYTTMIMYFMAQGIDLPVIMNSNIISEEILNVIVGSFGLVTVAPFTAFSGALIFHSKST